jgi:hypothetical protein
MSLVCDTTGHVCVECNRDVDCNRGQSCSVDHACVAAVDAAVGVDSGVFDAGTNVMDAGTDVVDAGTNDAAMTTGDGGSDCDPSTVSHLYAWYVASSGVTVSAGSVTRWAPRGGSAAPLTGTASMTTMSTIGGLPAVDFTTGTMTESCGAACPSWPVGTMIHVAFVQFVDGPPRGGSGDVYAFGPVASTVNMVPHGSDSGYDWLISVNHGAVGIAVTATVSPVATPHLATLTVAGGTATAAVDLQALPSISNPTVAAYAPMAPSYVGAFSGRIAEIIVAIGALSASEVDCIDRHLMTTYAITPR